MPRNITKTHNKKALQTRRQELRNHATPAEAELWKYLKKSQLRGRKFRRQHRIGPYIVDFYCPAEQLAVELDGAVHNDPARRAYDTARAAFLQEQGIRLVRFENRRVFEDVALVLEGIAWHFEE